MSEYHCDVTDLELTYTISGPLFPGFAVHHQTFIQKSLVPAKQISSTITEDVHHGSDREVLS